MKYCGHLACCLLHSFLVVLSISLAFLTTSFLSVDKCIIISTGYIPQDLSNNTQCILRLYRLAIESVRERKKGGGGGMIILPPLE